MSVAERWDDDAADVIGDVEAEDDEPVNLAAERQNPIISMAEFAGDFT